MTGNACKPAVVLSAAHRRELELGSAIDVEVITERGYRSLEHADRDELGALGIAVASRTGFPGLLLPMFRATGEPISAQFKPATPVKIKGKPVKYLSPRGVGNHIDVHPRNRACISDVTVPLWITEGVKKGDSLTSRGCCVVTLTGVFNWRGKFGTLGDWEDVPLKGRDVVLCFDADASKNMNVARAMVRLGRWCRSKGAKKVRYLIVPSEVSGTATKGVDDYFAAGGVLESLIASATTTEPDTETTDDTFSDSRLAETIADEVLTDRYVWCKGLGWMSWTGQRWLPATEETVGEATRRHVLERFEQASAQRDTAALKGWYSMLTANRQAAVLKLARGVVERTADEFDSDPDLLNTPEGIVHLPTGAVWPHDSDLLMTKITRGCYRLGFTHRDWDQALAALREDARPWFQARLGQAITGHPTPDGVIPICQGGGENGKSALLTDGLLQALGDYATPGSPKLIATRNEHSTERADLRGQRLVVAEELTEDRALNITAIKQITDVGSIKARYVHKDNITFSASHSLLITSNYRPTVNETDHGTWRRFALVEFPFTFRKPGEALSGAFDRAGDPHLKARLRAGKQGQHDAVITWAVEGARASYRFGFPPLPHSVEASTRSWRMEADRILAFWEECLVADSTSGIATTDLLTAFNAWMKSDGHHEWSKESFHSRFKSHVETARRRVEDRRPRRLDMKISRPAGMLEPLPGRPYVYVGVRLRRQGSDTTDGGDQAPTWSERSDPSMNLSPAHDSGNLSTGLGRSVHECCEGGLMELKCRLCRRSSIYWDELPSAATPVRAIPEKDQA